ncbi:PEPxxWA-CTERM sorting domain-containing protein [Sphingomonas sp. ID1715]|uniref:PEPxxWA-CTERM sorting domain-containing protein n=1 Tax=Sphingomonas sp. ID1715 TaxID=1656898 RepID=UPI0014883760|nr:PEPxxWA-CTERM sorting domain-containing protein [Sphingomonas sp. ID1715]NNM77224.1 PEPxxWA-CTERM sorting domain-containing protein [Sphingomonas sp. ID1715]
MKGHVLAVGLMLIGSAPAYATTVFSDNFDAENGGATALNYSGFANFNVNGQVDLVKSGDFGIVCAGGSGSCVDLDGTSGPGTLLTSTSFSFNAGDMVRFTFDISGNQRGGASDPFKAGFSFGDSVTMINYGYNFSGTDVIAFANVTTTGVTTSTQIDATDPFSTKSIFFTAGNAGTLRFTLGTDSGDNVGPVVDNLRLDVNAAVPEPASWALMIAGFGLAGAALRRRTLVALAA